MCAVVEFLKLLQCHVTKLNNDFTHGIDANKKFKKKTNFLTNCQFSIKRFLKWMIN